MTDLIRKFIPPLSSFNWARAHLFNRVLWYVIFALCLTIILGINTFIIKTVKLPKLFFRYLVYVILCLQIGYIMLPPVVYNDQIKTWLNELGVKTGLAGKLLPNRKFAFISYKEFFAQDLFDRIKNDISYSDEKVAALGYHPAVLMYNGFNCIDGHNNMYPLSYIQKFKTLIAPELEVNEKARDYFDHWSVRIYLVNSELGYEQTRDKDPSPVKLNIDMNVFKNDFDGVYILSRAEISNNDALGLDLVKRYYDDESIYTIYLYQCNK